MQHFKYKSSLLICLTASLLCACVTVQPTPPNPTASPTPSATPTSTPSPTATPSQPATALSQIGYGKSYGFCLGYCEHSLTVTATSMHLAHTAPRDPAKYPDRAIDQPTPAATWQKLTSLANFKTFQAQPDRIGCPDCADGGAEWVLMQQDQTIKRVTFEPQDGLPQQAELLSELKRLYQELDAKLPPQ